MKSSFDVTAINWEKFGKTLHSKRIEMGYRSMTDFVYHVYDRTRLRLSPQAMCLVESGKQAPSVKTLIAVCTVLFDQPGIPEDIFESMAGEVA